MRRSAAGSSNSTGASCTANSPRCSAPPRWRPTSCCAPWAWCAPPSANGKPCPPKGATPCRPTARASALFTPARRRRCPPSSRSLGTKPGGASGAAWSPVDSLAWSLMMALDLGGNWGTEFARLSAARVLKTGELWQLFPPYPGEQPASNVDFAKLYADLGVYRTDLPGAPAKVSGKRAASAALAMAEGINDWAAALGEVDGKGSNNWVVAGAHSASGKPLLANDPHLGLSAPAIWYFARLQAPAGAALRRARRHRRDLARPAFCRHGPHREGRLGIYQHRARRAGPLPGADQPGQPAAVPRAVGRRFQGRGLGRLRPTAWKSSGSRASRIFCWTCAKAATAPCSATCRNRTAN
jgi:hypothetical protein